MFFLENAFFGIVEIFFLINDVWFPYAYSLLITTIYQYVLATNNELFCHRASFIEIVAIFSIRLKFPIKKSIKYI